MAAKPSDDKSHVAEKISDATLSGQIGTIKPLPDSEKADPSSIFHVQTLDGTPLADDAGEKSK